jgi:hypothetical protein
MQSFKLAGWNFIGYWINLNYKNFVLSEKLYVPKLLHMDNIFSPAHFG